MADKRDPVTIEIYLSEDYAANSKAMAVEDDLVNNDYGGIRHKSYGYLRTPEMNDLIVDFLFLSRQRLTPEHALCVLGDVGNNFVGDGFDFGVGERRLCRLKYHRDGEGFLAFTDSLAAEEVEDAHICD